MHGSSCDYLQHRSRAAAAFWGNKSAMNIKADENSIKCVIQWTGSRKRRPGLLSAWKNSNDRSHVVVPYWHASINHSDSQICAWNWTYNWQEPNISRRGKCELRMGKCGLGLWIPEKQISETSHTLVCVIPNQWSGITKQYRGGTAWHAPHRTSRKD